MHIQFLTKRVKEQDRSRELGVREDNIKMA
jgi:hypothetical protein